MTGIIQLTLTKLLTSVFDDHVAGEREKSHQELGPLVPSLFPKINAIRINANDLDGVIVG